MKQITVEVPDTVDLWTVERAVLEAVEPGSAVHARRIHWDSQGMVGATHVRLGVTVKEVR